MNINMVKEHVYSVAIYMNFGFSFKLAFFH